MGLSSSPTLPRPVLLKKISTPHHNIVLWVPKMISFSIQYFLVLSHNVNKDYDQEVQKQAPRVPLTGVLEILEGEALVRAVSI